MHEPERTLANVRRALREAHGEVRGPGLTDPFQLVLWEQVAYLADDEKRRQAFELLEQRVGLTPAEVAAAKPAVLKEVALAGGTIAAEQRAERMAQSARRVLDEWGGHLENVLELPFEKAVIALRKFPMIGRPGAEKILLLCGVAPVLALDSNALRVLLRLGYGREDRNYDRSYRSVRRDTAKEERRNAAWLADLHHLLRRHGQTVCRSSRPDCAACPLKDVCAFFAGSRRG